MKLRYMLYGTVCIVMIFVIVICIWWFTTSAYTKEDFIVPAPYMVMAGLTSSGTVYYADIDVPMSPKWIKSTISGIGDIAGSYGILYTVNTGGSGVGYGPYDSSRPNRYLAPQTFKEISVDDDGTVVGSNNSVHTISSPAASGRLINNTLSPRGSVSGGKYFHIGNDNNLYYHDTLTTSGVKANPRDVTSITQVSYDGAVCILDNTGAVWCADTNVGAPNANWAKQGTRAFSQISLRGGRIVGIGTDGAVYYSNTYINPSWSVVSTQEYNPNTGATQGGTQTFKKVILFFPALDARRRRFAPPGKPCGNDEQQIGNFCYGPCASGRAAVGTRCPYRRKQTPPIPSCPSGEYINGACYQACPDRKTTAQGQLCVGNTTIKDLKPKLDVTPENYSCGDGTVRARYVRIRPTNLPSVTNNKLCISKVEVKDADGNVLNLLSGTPSVQSTIGSISGTWIDSGKSSIPVLSMNPLSTGGSSAGSSGPPLNIYVASYGTTTVMVADDTVGTAKYYTGAASAWTSTYWTSGSSAGTRASKYYMLTLNTSPVAATASDGTCIDSPIGGKTCSGSWNTYLSSNKYDTEPDGGRQSREVNTYWDLDLGMVQKIRSVEFTGCNYVPASGRTNTQVNAAGLSQPNADQITGMRIQLLQSSNLPTAEAYVERTLGPQINQLFEFRYLTKVEGIDDKCYDACPKINGVQSVDAGQNTCIAALGGMTSRSITSPLRLPPPVCSLPVNPDGTPFVYAAQLEDNQAWNIGNWQIDPTNPEQVLSCDLLPGSKLIPLQNNINIPKIGDTGRSTLSFTLTKPNGSLFTVPNGKPPFKCAIMNDSVCEKYNTGTKVYRYRGGVCVRMDVSPDFELNDNWHWSGDGTPGGVTKDPCPSWASDDDGTVCWCHTGARRECGRGWCLWLAGGGECRRWGVWDCIDWGWGNRSCTYNGWACADWAPLYEYNRCRAVELWERNVKVGCPSGKQGNDLGWLCWNPCPAGYSHYRGGGDFTYGWCQQDKRDPTWGKKWDRRWNNQNYSYRYAIRGAKTLYDLVKGNDTSDDFKIPLIIEDKAVIVDPMTFPAQCKCLNPDGTVNREAYMYDKTCIKCPNPNQIFHAKGVVSSEFAWSNEHKNKFLSPYNDAVTEWIDQKPFTSFNDAKTSCESEPLCKGLTRSTDSTGKAYYYMRAGTTLTGRAPSSGSSGSIVSSATAGSRVAGSRQQRQPATMDSSWIKGDPVPERTKVGDRNGKEYTTENIPTAFADDYTSPTSKGMPTFSVQTSTVTDLVNKMTDTALNIASTWAYFQNSVQNPNTYYALTGTDRELFMTKGVKTADNGICVAPCDPKHTKHDAIKMTKSTTVNNVSDLYTLTGTTCHDATQTVISRPNIGGIYTPQVGANCRAGYDLNANGSCMEECDSNSLDNGSSCSENSFRRPSIAPTLRCPQGLELVGGTCLHPCGEGYTNNADYCEPNVTTVDLPDTINCVKTPYTYSSKYEGSSMTVDKWLCDSDYDQQMLLEGPSETSIVGGTMAYVKKNDIICYADDASTGMYYCQSYSDAINQVESTQRTDFSKSCDSMTKAYMDLSDNLTSLLSATTTAQNASVQVAAMQMVLESVIDKMCGSSGSSGSSRSATCNSLRTQLMALKSNINSGSGAVQGVLSPINIATSSRDKLIRLLRDMKCCPVGDTGYPWC